jgi:eukaryotic-like serine/threonine-protein kinase
LRAAAALAKYDRESEKWATVQEAVANDLVAVPAVYLATWLESLRPVREKVLTPLAGVYRDGKRRETERSLATDILADYAADNPQLLANLVMDADARQFVVLYPKLQRRADEGVPILSGEIERTLPADLPSSDERREKLAKRQANAAVALLRMNHAEKVWPLLKRSDKPDDPRVRSYLIHCFGPMGADAAVLVKLLEEEPDVTIRRALILSLGPEEFGEGAWTPEGKKVLVERLQALYRTASDPGLHASAEWLLRTWKDEEWLKQENEQWAKDKDWRDKKVVGIKKQLASRAASAAGVPPSPPQWYVNTQGQTMVVIPGPVEFMMGSPAGEEEHLAQESQHQRRIGRTYALASKSVTVQEFRRFVRDKKLEAWWEAGGLLAPVMKKYSPEENGPIIYVDWYRAAAYCNWLSEQEGIEQEQWCYETDPQGQVTKLKGQYLSLTGYRLPQEAEMEYACRAGAVTSRYYGESEELLPKYGWYQKNSGERTRPVGVKKPNDLGLFDMHGNVFNWCQEHYQGYPAANKGSVIEDKEDILDINSSDYRVVLRGGSFVFPASSVRSALRSYNWPTVRNYNNGIRAARTFAP